VGYKAPTPSMARQMINVMNCIERKFKDIQLYNAAVGATQTDLSILGTLDINQGDAVDERHGKSIYLKSLYIHFKIADATAPLRATTYYMKMYRVLVVQIRQNNNVATPLTMADLFSKTTNQNYLNAPRNMEKVDNYKILYDRKWTQKGWPISTTQTIFPELQKKAVIRFKKPLEIVYKSGSTTGTPTDIQDVDLHLLIYCDAGAEGYVVASCRCKWTD